MINKPINEKRIASGNDTLPIKYSKKFVGVIPTKCSIQPHEITVIVAAVEPTDTQPVNFSAIQKAIKHSIATSGDRIKTTPRLVATAFPPLKSKNIEYE